MACPDFFPVPVIAIQAPTNWLYIQRWIAAQHAPKKVINQLQIANFVINPLQPLEI